MGFESVSKGLENTKDDGGKERFHQAEQLHRLIRGITFPTALLLAALNTQEAGAVEIPKDASLETTISLLQQAARMEQFETAVTHITLSDGTILILQNEGAERMDGEEAVAVYNPVFQLEQQIDFGQYEGGSVTIYDLHNHPDGPIRDILSQVMPHAVGEAGFISTPPSNGFLRFGDTLRYEGGTDDVSAEKLINQLEVKYDLDIAYVKQVVDPLGIWSYSHMSEADWQTQSPDIFAAYQAVTEHTPPEDISGEYDNILATDPELAGAMEILTNANRDVDGHFGAWLVQSQKLSIEDLSRSEYYRNLVEAYENAGINLSFQPVDISE